MLKVTALTSSRQDPSTRFRVRQFIRPLARFGVRVSEHYPVLSKYRFEPLPALAALLRAPGLLASRFGDVTWFGRELLSGRAGLERFAGGRKLFDVDDAIWLAYPSNFSEEIALLSDGVIAGNRFIAEHYERAGARVWIVPTSIDTDVWTPAKEPRRGPFTVGWTGERSNLKYLLEIEEPLADFLNEHAQARLLVVSNRRPEFKKIPAARWRYESWSPQREVALVQEMDVGLMPLADNDWSRGKCAFKLLSYMSVGLPFVASPVGVNAELLEKGEVGYAARDAGDWYDALRRLASDREAARRMGAAGRTVVEEGYSVKTNAPKLARIFREVAGV